MWQTEEPEIKWEKWDANAGTVAQRLKHQTPVFVFLLERLGRSSPLPRELHWVSFDRYGSLFTITNLIQKERGCIDFSVLNAE
jgi:hypothetical protein